MSRNRRLVPMPTREKPRASNAPKVSYAGPPAAPIVPTFGNSWPYFAFLIVTAVALYYLKWPVLLIAALAGFFIGLNWLCRRFPRTMFVILFIVNALLSSRRRR
jgi:hypothetical protein